MHFHVLCTQVQSMLQTFKVHQYTVKVCVIFEIFSVHVNIFMIRSFPQVKRGQPKSVKIICRHHYANQPKRIKGQQVTVTYVF